MTLRITLATFASVLACAAAHAQSAAPPGATPPTATGAQTAVDCSKNPDPYKNYACLDTYLGTGVGERLFNYYSLEMGQSSAPSDPNAPPGLFTAVQEQLGLKFEPAKAAVDVFVVDRVERPSAD